MSDSTAIPCHLLAPPTLIARVASCMNVDGILTDPPFPLRAGFCRICGHQLPKAYSITACQELPSPANPEGAFKQILLPHGTTHENVGAEGVALSDSIALVYAKDDRRVRLSDRGSMQDIPTVVVAAIACCDCLSTEVFDAATRIKRQQAAERERAKRNQLAAREGADVILRKKAAAAMARADANRA